MKKYQEAYGVSLCFHCRKGDGYALLTRTDAKSKYLLNDEDLKPLGHITKPNPTRNYPRHMYLYLEKQVVELAHRKHGGEEGIEAAKQRQIDRRIDKGAAKRKNIEKEFRKKRRIEQKVEEQILQEKVHEHEFNEEVYDKEEDLYRKTCKTCGMKMEYEKL